MHSPFTFLQFSLLFSKSITTRPLGSPSRPAVYDSPRGRRSFLRRAARPSSFRRSRPRTSAITAASGRTRQLPRPDVCDPLPRRTILRLPCSPADGRVRSPCRGRTLIPRSTACDRARLYSATGRMRSPRRGRPLIQRPAVLVPPRRSAVGRTPAGLLRDSRCFSDYR